MLSADTCTIGIEVVHSTSAFVHPCKTQVSFAQWSRWSAVDGCTRLPLKKAHCQRAPRDDRRASGLVPLPLSPLGSKIARSRSTLSEEESWFDMPPCGHAGGHPLVARPFCDSNQDSGADENGHTKSLHKYLLGPLISDMLRHCYREDTQTPVSTHPFCAASNGRGRSQRPSARDDQYLHLCRRVAWVASLIRGGPGKRGGLDGTVYGWRAGEVQKEDARDAFGNTWACTSHPALHELACVVRHDLPIM